jgi:YD repeat-containing protein
LLLISGGGTTYASIPEPPTGYNAALQLLTLNYGNGVTATFGYSPSRQQMTGPGYAKGAQTLFSLQYYYQQDPTNCSTGPTANNGQIACIKDLVDDGRTQAFTYDALGRLISAVTNGSAAYAKWGLSEGYDQYGNRLSQTVTAGTGPSNALSVATTSGGGAYTNRPDGYSFDVNGNMLNDGVNTLTYDAEDQLITSSGSLGSGNYTYDGNGFRIKKVSGGTTTVAIYSASNVIAEYVNGAAPTSPSVVGAKAAMRGHFKTGHMEWPRT